MLFPNALMEFISNEMISNANFLLSPDKFIQVNTGTIQVENNRCEQLLSVAVDANLSFECQFVIKSWQIHTSKYRHHTNWKQQVWKVTARSDWWKTEHWKSELRNFDKSKSKTKGFCKGCISLEKREIIYLCKHF